MFYGDYEREGPNLPGLSARQASDCQILFHSRVENLHKRYETYNGGEQLFGLPITEYPRLEKIRRDLRLLQRLYTLYNKVLDTVRGYYDIPWLEVKIDKIKQELKEFQDECLRMPKALQEFPAYHQLKKTLNDFNESKISNEDPLSDRFIFFLFQSLSSLGNVGASCHADTSLETNRRTNWRNEHRH